MTKEEKRELNRQYYLKNRERLMAQSRVNYQLVKEYRKAMYDPEKRKEQYAKSKTAERKATS